MNRNADELAHLIMQLARAQQQENRLFAVGHIASYDPTRHYVTVLIPKYRDPDTGDTVVSPWMPLGTHWAGSGFGMQIAPHGGATAANPAAGELCIVEIIEREVGVAWCAHLAFSQTMPPPLPGIAAGEAIVQHESGTYLYFKKDGSLSLNTNAALNATVGTNLTATVSGNLSATVTGTATITAAAAQIVAATIKLTKALSDSLMGLCTSAFYNWAATHTHGSPAGPGPTTAPPANSLTSVVSAE